ncbi:hypothetical protein ABB30_13890 [Stenotrophomonas ginsengisoli]|uniref:Lysoplasmalogenase n=1 Tax=Stenotrophomonas ginsengisoli TaxID=336566 RepID=A0A0R0CZP3_9GAMM|nr:lysoplasmalogenase [Stenotrophomonas ginsengisoli]KRG74470.1 hypothetical protein ABB30_13890 [Stenotrophomonas ginsengisoli]
MSAGGRAGVLAVLAAGAIIGALGQGPWWWLHWLCKPLATLWLIAWVAGMTVPVMRQGYRRWVLAGLCLSLLGDVLLMLPQGLFVPGLVAFLLAHLCYIAAFAGDARAGALPAGIGLATLIGAGNLLALWQHLPAAMQVPVSAYVLVIAAMAALALAGAMRRMASLANRLAAGGALLFVASDSWLAWDRFAGPLPLAIVGVLLTYWAAQYLIAASVQAGSCSDAAGPQ